MQEGLVIVPHTARVVIYNRPQGGEMVLLGQDLVDLLLILRHDECDFGVVQNEAHLLRDRVLIDRHGNGAEALRGAHGEIEPRPVVADDGDLLSALQAERFQAGGELAHRIAEVGPGPRLPDAEVLLPDGG